MREDIVESATFPPASCPPYADTTQASFLSTRIARAGNQDSATLGEKVVLPPFLEPQRERIVGALQPID